MQFGDMLIGRFNHRNKNKNTLQYRCERFFLSINYHFLGGYTNHRIEDLLMLLHGNVADFYNYIEQLARSGRMKNMRNEKDKRGQLLAEEMMKAGLDRLIEWETDTQCIVPSQTNQNTYEVDLLKATCNCPAAPQGGLCKHYHLALNVATAKGVCIEQERVQAAASIYEIGDYFHDFLNKSIEKIDNSSSVSVVCTDTFSCSCYANSHGIECICLKVARQIVPSMNSSSLISSYPDNHVDYIPMELSIEDSIRVKLGEINAFVNGDGLRHMSENKKKMLMNSLSNTRNVCVLTDFCKTNRKRKQEPLFPNRKTKSEDHSYACTSTSKTSKIATPRLMEDGGFKNKCRNKGSLRKDF
ncbi:unnamed protein product [Mytilus edulis]|uniref:SWIM-type domain-containing protein n=1 Tax=Mytilus edulis TaxID=6550 RepID=A0A8S3SQD7_MYTED|nr:unnamed protein product [Mytilus edulis]